MYVRYNTRLRERSLQRRQNIDLILVEEIDLDDKWIVKKVIPSSHLIFIWLKDDELFNVDVIRIVSSKGEEIQEPKPSIDIVSSSIKRKHDDFASKC